MESRHLSLVMSVDAQRAYDFAGDPDNLPMWAQGLAAVPVRREDDELVVTSPMGEVRVRFVPRNEYGASITR